MRNILFPTSFGELPIHIKDNRAKTSVVFIHGFKADWSFAKNIYARENNFNIIAIDFSKITKLSFPQIVEAIDEVVQNFLKGKHFVFLGHSMGAAIVLSLKNRERIEQMILVSPLNPSIVNSINFSAFEKMFKATRAMRKAGDAIVKGGSKLVKSWQQNLLLQEMLNRESDYKNVVENHLMNREFIEQDLDQLFKKHHAKYVIGALDQIIPTTQFINYVSNELDSEIKVVRWARHNPFKDNPDAMQKYLNEVIPFEKRFFLNKFYTASPSETEDVDSTNEAPALVNSKTAPEKINQATSN